MIDVSNGVDFLIAQASNTAVAFYEKLGFVQVETRSVNKERLDAYMRATIEH